MKHFQPAIIGLLMLCAALIGCDPEEPVQPEVIPDSFPKKQLLEKFTSQYCGYCAYGMDCIHDFVQSDTNFIELYHHYGYAADHFSVSGSKTITNALKVSGTPSITINRAKTSNSGGKKVVFHPAYLSTTNKAQFETSTYASVNIRNTYNPSTRELRVVVLGALCKADFPSLYLTVLVKESGMIDTQADYYNTFQGWQQFRHVHAVRAYLSEPKGDLIAVTADRHYEEQYVLTLNDKWNADNCMVVAFLSEEFQPVIQAEQRPVVANTKGGMDIVHAGITPKPVPAYYPEPNATDGPAAFSGNAAEQLTTSIAHYRQYPDYDITYWLIEAYNTEATFSVGGTTCLPFVGLYVLAPYDASAALPTGTFPISDSNDVGTAAAGYRDDAKQQLGGSTLYFTGLTSFNQGYLDPQAQWLITDGTLTITDEGWTLDGHARNGSEIHLVGTTPITNSGALSAPLRNSGFPDSPQHLLRR